MKNNAKWIIFGIVGVLIIGMFFVLHGAFLPRAMFFLLMCCFIGMLGVFLGPTAPDRAVAATIVNMVIIGFCGILALFTEIGWYIDIAFVWGVQSFITSLTLAKFLENKRFDE